MAQEVKELLQQNDAKSAAKVMLKNKMSSFENYKNIVASLSEEEKMKLFPEFFTRMVKKGEFSPKGYAFRKLAHIPNSLQNIEGFEGWSALSWGLNHLQNKGVKVALKKSLKDLKNEVDEDLIKELKAKLK